MGFMLLALSLMFLLVAAFTPYIKTGLGLTILSLVGYFYLTPASNWAAVGLVVIGLTLVVLEIFIPSFGLIGIVGATTLYWGLVKATGDAGQAAVDLILAVLLTSLFFIWLFKSGYVNKQSQKIILHSTSHVQKNDEAAMAPRAVQIGDVGTAYTPLRPAGKMLLAEKHQVIDVMTTGELIAKGSPIVIVQIVGTKIVVQRKQLTESDRKENNKWKTF